MFHRRSCEVRRYSAVLRIQFDWGWSRAARFDRALRTEFDHGRGLSDSIDCPSGLRPGYLDTLRILGENPSVAMPGCGRHD